MTTADCFVSDILWIDFPSQRLVPQGEAQYQRHLTDHEVWAVGAARTWDWMVVLNVKPPTQLVPTRKHAGEMVRGEPSPHTQTPTITHFANRPTLYRFGLRSEKSLHLVHLNWMQTPTHLEKTKLSAYNITSSIDHLPFFIQPAWLTGSRQKIWAQQ